MRRLAIVVLLAGLAHADGAGERPKDAPARARKALDLLVRELRGDQPPAAPSLTRRLADLAACGDEAVRGVLAEFWARAGEQRSLAWTHAEQVESLVRMLYGLGRDPEWSRSWTRFRVFGGAVLHCVPDLDFTKAPPYSPSLPPLDELLAGRSLQRVPVPDAEFLLQAVRSGGAKAHWSRRERECGYSALGEAAAESPEAVEELVALFRAAPEDQDLALALARTETPPARAALAEVLTGFARRLASGKVPECESFKSSRAMRYVGGIASGAAPAEVRAAIAAAERETRKEMLALAGMGISIPLLLAEYDTAETQEARLTAFRGIRDLILSQDGDQFPRAADVPRLLELFLAVAPDLPEAERGGLWWAAEWLLYAHVRRSAAWSFASGEVSFQEKGGSIGPYPDMETTVRHMKEDLSTGRLIFLDPGEGPGVFGPPLRRLGIDYERANSDVRPPEFMSQPKEGFPVFAAAKWVPEGLEISLTNRGREPFLVNPRIARYARAEVTTAEGSGPRGGTSLHLVLGFIGVWTAVPAAELVRIDPGASFRWVQRVRPEHREIGPVVISFYGADDVIGGADHPVLAALNDTWVR
ncbi:MAG: hypothetical protein MUE73_13405 [Planctomycetes bacterium]|jgi:hypothetical protein|nr:hypothetical protein [Planctomycetota bacterium]